MPDNFSQMANGSRYFGELVLKMGPLVLSGRVVEKGGKGISGVSLHFYSLQEGGFVPEQAPGDDSHVTSDGNGGFQLFGDFQGRPIILCAYKEGYKQILREKLKPGSMGVCIEMERACAIEGELILDSVNIASQIRVYFQKGGKGPCFTGALKPVKGIGWEKRFRFAYLRGEPGDWTVSIQWQGHVLWKRRGVLLGQEDGASYKFSEPVDLRGRFKTFTYRVLSESGKPLSKPVSLFVAGPEGKVFKEVHPFMGAKGMRAFPVPSSFTPLALSAKGCYPTDIRALPGNGEVVLLKKGVPVALTLDIPASFTDKDKVFFRVRLLKLVKKEAGLATWMERVLKKATPTILTFGSQKKTLYLPGYGTYRVTWHIASRKYGLRNKGVPIKQRACQTIEVKEGEENRFTLSLEKEEIERAVSGLLDE